MQADLAAHLPGIVWQVEAAEARHIEKGFIDGIDFDLWGKSGQRCHYPRGHIAVERIVRGEDCDIMLF